MRQTLFSVFGDSISTLEHVTPTGYVVFYEGLVCELSGVRERHDTWWGKVIDALGGRLLVNNAWSGSRVTKLPDQAALFPSACSEERCAGLHNVALPDVILIYLGVNDWLYGASPEQAPACAASPLLYFPNAYALMLQRLRCNYPQAELWCCTLPLSRTLFFKPQTFPFPPEYGGVEITAFNQAIRSAASRHGCRLLDLSRSQPYSDFDGLHPDSAGMQTLAESVLRAAQ